MPGGDGTGPAGYGSRTGGGQGNCPPETRGPIFNGGGRGMRFGLGRRMPRNWFGGANYNQSDNLNEEKNFLTRRLEQIEAMLAGKSD